MNELKTINKNEEKKDEKQIYKNYKKVLPLICVIIQKMIPSDFSGVI
jgi:hypothetical protein